ncbi:peptide ABC transporter substrate-binding protein [Fontivita pretiosa]|uniref:peptide ABC transporter substrate-binding protein n=1 Tax=Fontivita pretiosa TaxID=2989684 RepID=UPI003D1876DB
MLRLICIPVALIAILLGSLAWSGGGKQQRADFTFINRGDIITLDLKSMSYLQDFRVTYAIREGLYSYDTKTLRPIPAGIVARDVSDDKRIWTFHLRPESRWTNGDPVVAADYVFHWRRMLEEPDEYTYLFYYIDGAKRYEDEYQAYLRYREKLYEHEQSPQRTPRPPEVPRPDFAKVGVRAIDEHTLEVRLTNPVPFLEDLLAFPPFYPMHEKSMQPFKEVDPRTGRTSYRGEFTRPPHVVTNGPFKLTRWEFKRLLWFEKSETYWDRANVKSNTLAMVVNENPLSQFLMYDRGDVEWLTDVSADVAAELKAQGRPDLRVFPAFGTAYLTLNCKPQFLPDTEGARGKNPLADVRVRQALAMAIDKKLITETITRMGEQPTTTYVPPNQLPGYQSRPGLPYDISRARQLLAEAGYPNGAGFPSLPILYNSESTTRRLVAQSIASQWRQNLGIDCDLQQLEIKLFRNKVTEKKYAIATVGWYGDYLDVSTFTDKYLSTSLQNDCDWQNPQYDALLEQAAREPDEQKRLRILEEAEHLLNMEAPIIPLYHYVNVWMHRDNVHGIDPNPKLLTMMKDVWVEK